MNRFTTRPAGWTTAPYARPRAMPLGLGSAHPGGMNENSPAQRFNAGDRGLVGRVPKGRPNRQSFSRRFGTYALRRAYPALKRWAFVGCPLLDIHARRLEILVALPVLGSHHLPQQA